ncbi:MAG: hypothetical protein VCD50_18205 [Alphaproteobacteria bacterium]|jgi:hypothetical protein
MKLNISTAVLAAGLLAAPLVYAHESAPATQGAGQKMGGHMMDQMNEMMKTCNSMMQDHEQFKSQEHDDENED